MGASINPWVAPHRLGQEKIRGWVVMLRPNSDILISAVLRDE